MHEDGEVYFYNAKTREMCWTDPRSHETKAPLPFCLAPVQFFYGGSATRHKEHTRRCEMAVSPCLGRTRTGSWTTTRGPASRSASTMPESRETALLCSEVKRVLVGCPSVATLGPLLRPENSTSEVSEVRQIGVLGL